MRMQLKMSSRSILYLNYIKEEIKKDLEIELLVGQIVDIACHKFNKNLDYSELFTLYSNSKSNKDNGYENLQTTISIDDAHKIMLDGIIQKFKDNGIRFYFSNAIEIVLYYYYSYLHKNI